MSEAKTDKPIEPPQRQRQTLELNPSTNEAQPREKALRRTYPGDEIAQAAVASTETKE